MSSIHRKQLTAAAIALVFLTSAMAQTTGTPQQPQQQAAQQEPAQQQPTQQQPAQPPAQPPAKQPQPTAPQKQPTQSTQSTPQKQEHKEQRRKPRVHRAKQPERARRSKHPQKPKQHQPQRTQPPPPRVQQPPPPAFTFATVQRLAQARAARPYETRSTPLPRELASLSYEQYSEIQFRPASALWHGQSMFEVQFFHRGFNFDRRVNIYEVDTSGVHPVAYSPSMFYFGGDVPRVPLPANLGFAGLRVHYPLNSPGMKDEVIAFLGASYFRALGRNEGYGVSARGLAIDTATPAGEEFPYFTDFYLVRPAPNQRTMTIYAVLDSPSIAGAYEFDVRPGTITQVQVTAELYPRGTVDKLGIAPLTSMFLYGESSEGRPFDDWRPEVHDSDGLMMQTGTGEWLWRPLDNPEKLQVNRFMDENPKGFGLMQRDRDFADYQDPDSQFERRPSYWIQPLGNWGKGGIELVEIPSEEEIHENIDAYWVPSTQVVAHAPIRFSYLMSAYLSSGGRWPPGGRVLATRFGPVVNGTSPVSGMRLVLIDFTGGDLDSLLPSQPVHADVSADGATINKVTVQRLPENGAWRVAIQVKPGGDGPVDLRCYLDLYGEALTETWTYQWNPSGA